MSTKRCSTLFFVANSRSLMLNDTFHPGPTVVFVDDAPWECFFQLAVILRKAGIRTVRVSVGLSKWHVDQILFDRHVPLPFPPTPEQLADILSSECVTDVQPTESLAMTTYAALNLLPASQRSDIWIGRSAFLDKWDVASTLRDLRIRTPDALLAEFTSPIEAVAQLTFPIVLKRRVGSSGSGVEVFDSLESLEQFVSRIEVISDWFYERFIHGQSLVCVICVGSDGVDVIANYEILKRVKPRGTSTVVEILNDERITENGRMLIDAIHIRGLVCIDIIRDSNDIDWIHDVNPRVFGSFLTCQFGGFDFCDAYIRYLTGRDRFEPSRADDSGNKSFVFPYGIKEVFRSGQLGTAWFRALKWTWRYWRLLGSRYFLSLAIRGLAFSIRRNRERQATGTTCD